MTHSGEQDALLEVPIRSSLWKSVLLAGADRRITIAVIGSCMVLVLLSRFSLWPCVTAAVITVLGQLIGIKLAGVDPEILDIYLRHLSFQRVYAARTDIAVPKKKAHPSVPKV